MAKMRKIEKESVHACCQVIVSNVIAHICKVSIFYNEMMNVASFMFNLIEIFSQPRLIFILI